MSAGDWKELYSAASSGNLSLVQYHISNGVNPNYQHPEILATPLLAAISHGHIAIAKYLLNHGADPYLVSEFDNMTALQAAKHYNKPELVELIQTAFPKQSLLEKIFKFLKKP